MFERYGKRIALVIHTAAQPSHDWAANDPQMDFTVNANGTLCVLEATRKFAPAATFIFTSTNKVYGDTPNTLPLLELETRWEIDPAHAFRDGIDESMSIDQSTHSLFGVSKVAADVLVQEYGRYFSMPTAVFRGGCLTGPNHSGTKLHGFLAYSMKCVATGEPYTVFGYKGKQVRDNIHSFDLVTAFDEVFRAPRVGEVYNMGGTRHSNCSMLEAIALCETIAGRKLQLDLHRGQPHRRSHLVYLRCQEVQGPLSELEAAVRSAADSSPTFMRRTPNAGRPKEPRPAPDGDPLDRHPGAQRRGEHRSDDLRHRGAA